MLSRDPPLIMRRRSPLTGAPSINASTGKYRAEAGSWRFARAVFADLFGSDGAGRRRRGVGEALRQRFALGIAQRVGPVSRRRNPPRRQKRMADYGSLIRPTRYSLIITNAHLPCPS